MTLGQMVGQRFDRLVVVKSAEKLPGKARKWLCRCDCGGEILKTAGMLREVKHTGCKACERLARSASSSSRTHGCAPRSQTRPRVYRIWKAMRQRCNDSNYAGWKYYGGRGVKVCAEWDDFTVFMAWAYSHGYADHLSIDRIDGAVGYEPGNCRWATPAEQTANRRPWGTAR